jgi:hypothetical protein
LRHAERRVGVHRIRRGCRELRNAERCRRQQQKTKFGHDGYKSPEKLSTKQCWPKRGEMIN